MYSGHTSSVYTALNSNGLTRNGLRYGNNFATVAHLPRSTVWKTRPAQMEWLHEIVGCAWCELSPIYVHVYEAQRFISSHTPRICPETLPTRRVIHVLCTASSEWNISWLPIHGIFRRTVFQLHQNVPSFHFCHPCISSRHFNSNWASYNRFPTFLPPDWTTKLFFHYISAANASVSNILCISCS